jgi:membrane fusion protein, multidrug efflux system
MEDYVHHQLLKRNNMTLIKSTYMKSNITNLTFALVVGVLLAACSAATPEENKEARLQKLKEEQASLAKEIAKLEKEVAAENPGAASKARAKEVAVAVLETRRFDHYIQTQGRIESESDIMVSSKAMGVVTQVLVNEGDQVTKGQTLAQIDNSVMVQSIQSMESQLELAKTVYERQENLWKQKIGTEVQYLQAKTNKESLEKQLASLREQNDMYRIKAPITGTIDAVVVKVGEAIQPGMPALRVVNNNDLKLVASLSEAFITKVSKGDKVYVNVSEQSKEIIGKVTFVGRTINPLSRTFDVEVEIPSSPELRPSMSANVKVVFNTDEKAIVVPVNIVQDINNEKVVYIAETKDNKTVATRKVVTVEGVFGGNAQVKGLNPGDKLITIGYQGLNDGDLVKI